MARIARSVQVGAFPYEVSVEVDLNDEGSVIRALTDIKRFADRAGRCPGCFIPSNGVTYHQADCGTAPDDFLDRCRQEMEDDLNGR